MKDPLADARRCATVAELLELFEEAWQGKTPPRLEDWLNCPAARNGADRKKLIEELIAVDLEYRWRGGASDRLRLDDYVRRHGELGRLQQLPLELIGQEYRVRHCWGDRPGHAEYQARFAGQSGLTAHLSRIDAELAAEFGRDRRGLAVSTPRPSRDETIPAAAAATGSLADTLRAQHLLTPAQLAELERGLARRFPEGRELARELLKRNWLTPYQVNQLLQGRGRELVVGPYILLERLGEGGAGQVFKARQAERVVALKVIRKELLADAEILGRFRREIQILSQLDHPNVVRAYDSGQAGDAHYLALEFVAGSDLGRMVKQGGALPPLQACAYIRQAALGLQHAHERGLVHRDIKPHNLIMGVRDGLIKVADLGLARLPRVHQEPSAVADGLDGTGTLTPRNAVIGTPDYMAPEQALEFRSADIRADIYSLGCTFYYLLTGQPPFAGGTLAQTLLRHQQAPPPALDRARKDVPPGLQAVLSRMLAKRPEDRYQTPAEVANALATLTGPVAQPTRRLPRLPLRTWWASPIGRRWILRVGAALFLLILGFALFYQTDEGRRRAAIAVIRDRSGTPEALQAARRIMELPSPLDRLDSANIPPELRTAGLPPEVVAVLHPGGTPKDVICVAFSYDGQLLASAGITGDIHLWDTATGRKRGTLKGHPDTVRALTFATDGTLASVGDDKTVRLWDVAAGRERANLGKQNNEGTCAAFTLDGKTLFTGCRGGLVYLWDVAGGTKKATIQTKQGGIYTVAPSPDGQTVALGLENGLELWKPGGPEPTAIPRGARLVAFAPTGKAIGHMSADQPLFQIRELDSGNAQGLEVKQTIHSAPRFLAFNLDGSALFTSIDDGSVIMWDTASKKQTGYWQMSWDRLTRPYSAALSPDGRYLATPHQNGNVYVRRLMTRSGQ